MIFYRPYILASVLFATTAIIARNTNNNASTANTAVFDSIAISEDEHAVFIFPAGGKAWKLISDSDSIFTVVSQTEDKNWILVSSMPANPDDASGMNESFSLYYIPQKRAITIEQICPKPGHWVILSLESSENGNYAIFSRIDAGNGERVKNVLLSIPAIR